MLGGKVPVGLVSSSRTSTAIELWSGPDALKQCDQTGVVGQGEMWEPRIVPLLPMAVAGWIWYQGESNVPCSVRWPHSHGMNCGIGCAADDDACDADPAACANFYACQFPALITDYRDKFRGGANKPFLFVELAPYTDGLFENDISLPLIREAQKAALKLPNVAMSSAIDLGDHESWMFNIHPRNKTLVGERLALHAQALAYGGNSVVHDGPVLVKATQAQAQNSFGVRVRLQFDGPVLVTQSPFNGICPAPANQCAWVAIDGVNGTIQSDPSASNAVIVEAPVASAKEVRYLFGDWPMPTIYGPTGLPAPAFRAPVSPQL